MREILPGDLSKLSMTCLVWNIALVVIAVAGEYSVEL